MDLRQQCSKVMSVRSSRHKPSNRRKMYLALVGKVERKLRDAYAKRYDAGEETQTSIAEKLGVNRSVINRRLSGKQNMTLETVADMAWALGQCVEIDIFDPAERPSNEPRILSEHTKWVIAQPTRSLVSAAVGKGAAIPSAEIRFSQ